MIYESSAGDNLYAKPPQKTVSLGQYTSENELHNLLMELGFEQLPPERRLTDQARRDRAFFRGRQRSVMGMAARQMEKAPEQDARRTEHKVDPNIISPTTAQVDFRLPNSAVRQKHRYYRYVGGPSVYMVIFAWLFCVFGIVGLAVCTKRTGIRK